MSASSKARFGYALLRYPKWPKDGKLYVDEPVKSGREGCFVGTVEFDPHSQGVPLNFIVKCEVGFEGPPSRAEDWWTKGSELSYPGEQLTVEFTALVCEPEETPPPSGPSLQLSSLSGEVFLDIRWTTLSQIRPVVDFYVVYLRETCVKGASWLPIDPLLKNVAGLEKKRVRVPIDDPGPNYERERLMQCFVKVKCLLPGRTYEAAVMSCSSRGCGWSRLSAPSTPVRIPRGVRWRLTDELKRLTWRGVNGVGGKEGKVPKDIPTLHPRFPRYPRAGDQLFEEATVEGEAPDFSFLKADPLFWDLDLKTFEPPPHYPNDPRAKSFTEKFFKKASKTFPANFLSNLSKRGEKGKQLRQTTKGKFLTSKILADAPPTGSSSAFRTTSNSIYVAGVVRRGDGGWRGEEGGKEAAFRATRGLCIDKVGGGNLDFPLKFRESEKPHLNPAGKKSVLYKYNPESKLFRLASVVKQCSPEASPPLTSPFEFPHEGVSIPPDPVWRKRSERSDLRQEAWKNGEEIMWGGEKIEQWKVVHE